MIPTEAAKAAGVLNPAGPPEKVLATSGEPAMSETTNKKTLAREHELPVEAAETARRRLMGLIDNQPRDITTGAYAAELMAAAHTLDATQKRAAK